MTQKNITRRAWISGAVFAVMALPALAQGVAISGFYNAEGRNPDGSPYAGKAVISEQNGSVQITWTMGNQSYSGTGVRNGQVVEINWGQPDPVIYVVLANGNLHGTWQNGRTAGRWNG